MPQDVQQWLTEIQSLQQRLADVSQERAVAYEQLARWQQSYQTEAQQRRQDIRRLQTVIYRLDQENKRLKQQLDLPPDARSPLFMANTVMDNNHEAPDTASPTLPAPSSQPNPVQTNTKAPAPIPPSITQLQQRLQEMVAECDRLSKALSQAQADHEQTRQTLMTALGDTVEQLERERQRHALSSGQSSGQRQQGQALTKQSVPTITAKQDGPNPPLPGKEQKQLSPAASSDRMLADRMLDRSKDPARERPH